jgi:hypothetical protein
VGAYTGPAPDFRFGWVGRYMVRGGVQLGSLVLPNSELAYITPGKATVRKQYSKADETEPYSLEIME